MKKERHPGFYWVLHKDMVLGNHYNTTWKIAEYTSSDYIESIDEKKYFYWYLIGKDYPTNESQFEEIIETPIPPPSK